MKRLLTVSFLIYLSFSAYSQGSDLKQAIKHYTAKNLGIAEKEIEQAIQTSFSSQEELAEAMYYYFVIKADLYCTKENLPNNVDRLGKIGDAYATCSKNDTEKRFIPLLNERVEQISTLLEDQATNAYASKNYLEYFHVLDYRLAFLEMIDRENGKEYQELAEHASMLGLNPLKIKYLKKMIKSSFNEKYAFKELLASLYEIEKYEDVDNLLKTAKQQFPQTDEFAAVEIKRLNDKKLKFSALQLAKEVIGRDPKNTEVVFLFGILNSSLNEHEEALSSFQRVAQLDPSHFETQLELGKYFYKFSSQTGHLDSAKVHLEKAYTLNQNEEITKELLHDVYMKLGLVQEAVTLSSY